MGAVLECELYMANHILRFYIKPEDIKNKFHTECKHVKFIKTNIGGDGNIEIECMVSDYEIIAHDNVRFALIDEIKGFIPLDRI